MFNKGRYDGYNEKVYATVILKSQRIPLFDINSTGNLP